MRKTLLVTDDFPPRRGGVATYYHEICRRLPAEAIAVLTVPVRAGAPRLGETFGYAVYRHPLLSTNPLVWPKWITAWRVLERMLVERHIQRVWVGQVLPYGTIAWLRHRAWNLPYVVSVHGMDVSMPTGRRRMWCGKILRSADHVVANSVATKDQLQGFGISPTRISVLTPGVNSPSPSRAAVLRTLQEQHGLADKKVILTVGRLMERKGHRQILAVLPGILQRVPQAHYVIVGDGQFRPVLQQFVRKLRLDKFVTFTGAVEASDLNAWYELADLFVMTPRPEVNGDFEGFGIVYLEAASHGKPVVATNIPGVREAVADGVSGLLVAPNDARGLQSAVTQLLLNAPQAHRLGLQGQDRALRNFGWETRAQKMASMLC